MISRRAQLVDDHRVWLSKLIDAAKTLNFLAWAVLVMVVVATTATIIHATRAALAVHYSYIEVLHLVGATKLLYRRTVGPSGFFHAFKGGLMGLAVALPVPCGGALDHLSYSTMGLLPRRLLILRMCHWYAFCRFWLRACPW